MLSPYYLMPLVQLVHQFELTQSRWNKAANCLFFAETSNLKYHREDLKCPGHRKSCKILIKKIVLQPIRQKNVLHVTVLLARWFVVLVEIRSWVGLGLCVSCTRASSTWWILRCVRAVNPTNWWRSEMFWWWRNWLRLNGCCDIYIIVKRTWPMKHFFLILTTILCTSTVKFLNE